MAVGLCFRDDAGQFLHAPIVWSPCKVLVLEAEDILVSQSLKISVDSGGGYQFIFIFF